VSTSKFVAAASVAVVVAELNRPAYLT